MERWPETSGAVGSSIKQWGLVGLCRRNDGKKQSSPKYFSRCLFLLYIIESDSHGARFLAPSIFPEELEMTSSQIFPAIYKVKKYLKMLETYLDFSIPISELINTLINGSPRASFDRF